VISDLQRLRVEAFGLFEAAKARADWKSAERVFRQLVEVVDRFGEKHRVLGPKGAANVNVDARTINVEGPVSADFMREYIRAVRAGDPVPEFPTPGAAEGTIS
jgi:hypothetical protein